MPSLCSACSRIGRSNNWPWRVRLLLVSVELYKFAGSRNGEEKVAGTGGICVEDTKTQKKRGGGLVEAGIAQGNAD